jgi:[pyruvate, water dikinase]-phosphate phosphotransferase / [pyruvate, water dikinase] kinase
VAKKRTSPKKLLKKETPPARDRYTMHLLAASTGELLSGLAAVAVSQFPDVAFDVVAHPLHDDLEKLQATLTRLSGERRIVLHALADQAAKELVRNKCVVERIPHFDATGPLFHFLADAVGAVPQNDVTRLHRLDATYRRRIEAMDFTLEHDDSLGLGTLREADIVIVGVSRVSKSPTALYLGSRGFKVANVSVASATGFPPVLAKISKKKVVALTTQPKRLQEIRTERARRMGSPGTEYDDLKGIIAELMAAEAEYRRRGYAMIDVTHMTIEQTAARILEALKLQAPV